MNSYYRTGQAAKQLGISSYQMRRLCETGLVESELTEGQQWKIPSSEINRLKEEGIPEIPQPSAVPRKMEFRGSQVPEGLYAEPSDDVVDAAEQVKITENQLMKRRLEKEVEETEDWFRARAERQAQQEAAEHQRLAALRAEHQRQKWVDRWMNYALGSVPRNARDKVEDDVYNVVEESLSRLQPTQPDYIVQRLVDAAVTKGLAPWKWRKAMETAIENARNRLPWKAKGIFQPTPWDIRVRQAAGKAVRNLSESASPGEMEAAALQAAEPICQEFVELDEQERKKQELEIRRRNVKLLTGLFLSHVQTYVSQEYEFEGPTDERETVHDLEEEIGPLLLEELMQREMDSQEIDRLIEQLVDERI